MRRYINFIPFIFFILVSANLIAEVKDNFTVKMGKTVIFSDGARYTGQWEDGKKHGSGRFIWADGSEYRGSFRQGKAHGKGRYIYPDGKIKRVRFRNGKLISSRMVSIQGQRNDCRYGEFFSYGRYVGWFRGSRIKGFLPHGRGKMEYINGSVYSGQWENGKMHGNGAILWDDGSRYIGQWGNGKRIGYGTYIWANGDKYIGQWKDNRMCGHGIYYYSDGRIKRGTWNEKKVKGIKELL